MTTAVTKESLAARIAELESGPRSLKEDYTLAAYKMLLATMGGVDDDVRGIIGLLETNEWAEHCTKTVLGSRLEAEITRLVGGAQQQPVVPDKMTAIVKDEAEYVEGWNDCRAAMLNQK